MLNVYCIYMFSHSIFHLNTMKKNMEIYCAHIWITQIIRILFICTHAVGRVWVTPGWISHSLPFVLILNHVRHVI